MESIPKYHTEWQIREKDIPKVILTNILELHILDMDIKTIEKYTGLTKEEIKKLS